MERDFFNLLGAPNNFMQEFLIGLRPYLIAFFVLVAAAGVGYGIYLAIWLAKAEHEEGRKKAWRRIFMALSSIMIIVILTVYMLSLDIGDVYDRENMAIARAGNFTLENSVFQWDPEERYPITLMFRGNPLGYGGVDHISWSTPISTGDPQKTGNVIFYNPVGDGEAGFIFIGASRPDTVDVYNLTATVIATVGRAVAEDFRGTKTSLGNGMYQIHVTIELVIMIYDPIRAPTPTPARPANPPTVPPISNPPPSGNWWDGIGGSGGGTGMSVQAITGATGFVWPISGRPPIRNTSIQQIGITSPMSGTSCFWSHTRTGHHGIDVVDTPATEAQGVPILNIAPGTVEFVRDWQNDTWPCNIRCCATNPNFSSAGNWVVIRHHQENGTPIMVNNQQLFSVFMHLQPRIGIANIAPSVSTQARANVLVRCPHIGELSVGQFIPAGHPVGLMGNTGHSRSNAGTGIHLHWEARLGTGISRSSVVCPGCLYF